jgi:hypothetical protein
MIKRSEARALASTSTGSARVHHRDAPEPAQRDRPPPAPGTGHCGAFQRRFSAAQQDHA